MNKRRFPFLVAFIFFLSMCFSFSQGVQQAPDYGKIIGAWKIEIDADGEYFYLTLNLRNVNGTLEGTISESQGYFTDVPVSEIVYDGENLSFEFRSPTPPDGVARLVRAEFKVGVDTKDGIISVPDLGVSAKAAGIREKL
ncbi:MAG: hypothetical protein QHH14_08245 [Clostridiales bacterium]|jgi:hypothetical protein|nr:hypothetical protein [Clostridiales bacterium]